MKTKIIFVIAAMILLFEAVLIPFSSGHSNTSTYQNHKILVYGNCYGISVNGDIKQGKGRGAHMFGKISADISIRNDPPLPPRLLGEILPYVLTIIYPDIGQIYKKTTLSEYIYLPNFVGSCYISDYYESWGPTRAIFFLSGYVDEIEFN